MTRRGVSIAIGQKITAMSFRYTGFADEASQDLDTQIEVLKQAGWAAIELRGVNGTNVADLTDDAWQQTLAKLRRNNLAVVGFGGQIANWARPVDSEFQADLDELERCAPRMKEAGTNLIRIMSYPNPADHALPRDQMAGCGGGTTRCAGQTRRGPRGDPRSRKLQRVRRDRASRVS